MRTIRIYDVTYELYDDVTPGYSIHSCTLEVEGDEAYEGVNIDLALFIRLGHANYHIVSCKRMETRNVDD